MISNLVEVYCLASNLTNKIDEHLKKVKFKEKEHLAGQTIYNNSNY